MRHSLFRVGLVVALLIGCAPETTLSVDAPESSLTVRASTPLPAPSDSQEPEPYVFFSTLDDDAFIEELDQLAKVVHPRYRLSTRTVSYESNNVARYLTTQLTNGVSRIVIWPFDQARVSRVEPIIDAFLEAGVAIDSGLPELQPVPVAVLTVSLGGEFFRFFRGTTRSELLGAAYACKSDYVINRERDAVGGFDLDATDMPDGRTRLFIDITVHNPDLARVTELQNQVGLILACLAFRVGESTEK